MSRKAQILAAALVALVLLVAGGFYYVYFYQPGGSGPPPPAETASTAPAAPGPAAPQAAAPGKLPDPAILLLDRAGVRRYSKVGQDIARQVQALADQARRELSAQQQQFSKDVQQFQAASAGLTAQQRDTRAADLDKRQAALQASAQRREAQLGATTQDAFAAVDKVMAPILQETVKAHHGNMVLDRASLPYAQPSMDITPEVIAQLDAKMPSYKVTLAPAK